MLKQCAAEGLRLFRKTMLRNTTDATACIPPTVESLEITSTGRAL
jgi:hypothetical protein